MDTKNENIINFLIAEGQKRLTSTNTIFDFETGIQEAENLLNDVKNYPHIFVLACIMDRQIKASRAWAIPYLVGKKTGGFTFKDFLKCTLDDIKKIFNEPKAPLHRFNNKMAGCFYSAIQDIHFKYADNAENIWIGNPKSALVIRRFLEFKGVGVKIANMATNILARDFKIKMQDYSSIDIAPDIQVRKYFVQNGLLRKDCSNEELIYLAKEIFPEFPGLLDIAAWEGGRKMKRI